MTESSGRNRAILAVVLGRRDRHLWRRQPVRRLLRHRADGAGSVSRGRHSPASHARGDRARHLDLHHVGDAGNTRRSRTPSRCLSSARRRSPRRVSASSPRSSCWASACGGWRARRRAARRAAKVSARAHGPAERWLRTSSCASARPLASEFDPAEIGHGQHAPSAARHRSSRPLPLVIVILVNLIMSLFVLPRLDLSFLAEARWGGVSLVRGHRRLGGDGGA